MKFPVLALAACLALSGCAATVDAFSDKVTTTVVENRESGPAPTGYEAAIKDYLHKTLKDPASAQYEEFKAPVLSYFSERTVTKPATLVNTDVRVTENRTYGWFVKVGVNAKNSYGAYVGIRNYTFVFRGNNIIHVDVPSAE